MYIESTNVNTFPFHPLPSFNTFLSFSLAKEKVAHLLLQLAVMCRPRLNQLQQRTDRSPLLECLFGQTYGSLIAI